MPGGHSLSILYVFRLIMSGISVQQLFHVTYLSLKAPLAPPRVRAALTARLSWKIEGNPNLSHKNKVVGGLELFKPVFYFTLLSNIFLLLYISTHIFSTDICRSMDLTDTLLYNLAKTHWPLSVFVRRTRYDDDSLESLAPQTNIGWRIHIRSTDTTQ